jgi:hypothetical protein
VKKPGAKKFGQMMQLSEINGSQGYQNAASLGTRKLV